MAQDEDDDGHSRSRVFRTNGSPCRNSSSKSPRPSQLGCAGGDGRKSPRGTFIFRVHGHRNRRHSTTSASTCSMPWENTAPLSRARPCEMKSFWIDKYPVTNARVQKVSRCDALSSERRSEFSARLAERNIIPTARTDKPVTWVSLEDARAYAAVGRQAAAARVGVAICGARHRRPRCIRGATSGTPRPCPLPIKGRTMRGPDDV